MNTEKYLETIIKRFNSGISGEHSYRGDLEILIRELTKGVEITNEPARITDCGNPDYVITKGKIPVGYIEAKDVGKDLKSGIYKEQFERYKKALDNLIITDYLWFRFFQNGKLVHEIRIGQIENNSVKSIPDNFFRFKILIQNFCTYVGQTVKSSGKLAEMMSAKALLLQNILERAITSDEKTQENSSLKEQYKTFKKILIHDLKPKAFADIYAQTLAYGMFAARFHDKTLDDFSRQKAAELIPKSNPFLRKLFGYVAGPDIDERIIRTVDNLADIFRAANVEKLLKNFGKNTQTSDPIIHFYENFLAKYDPKLRKSRGVWYTPEAVVKFIVRAVDDILKTEFNLPHGIADTSKTKIKVSEKGKIVNKKLHKVQILDPATGTGTFLAEVVKHIYNTNSEAVQGAWSSYLDDDLIPRLNGFEILMASYAMAHLKLDMILTETGYKRKDRTSSESNRRFNIYLTNSLEEHHPDTETLFAEWLSKEANEANHIKRDAPVMVVLGNPPYSGISINKSKWIRDLIEDYKYVNGKHFGERKHWLQDDYVKFLRFGEHYINKNGEGILAYINNHGFLDNPTFRGMRWHLLKSFDKIYIIDLHGNSKKKEVCPDGGRDENVFDITTGVSINIFVKTGKKKNGELAEVLHYDAWGKRQEKYRFLLNNNIKTVPFKKVNYREPFYFFLHKNFEGKKNYDKGFKINELMKNNKTGIVSMGDNFIIEDSRKNLLDNINDFLENNYSEQNLKLKYGLGKNYAKWITDNKNKNQIKINNNEIVKISYRPFDEKWTIFNNKFLWRWRLETMQHFFKKENVGLVTARQCASDWRYIFISKLIGVFNLTGTAGRYGSGYFFPLYRYPSISRHPKNKKKKEIQIQLKIVRKHHREARNFFNKTVKPFFAAIENPNKNSTTLYEENRTSYEEAQSNVEYLKNQLSELDIKPLEEFKNTSKRIPNLDMKTIEKIAETLGLKFENEKSGDENKFAPIDILDYIYAVLHSPTYREKYKEFLKIDFPRIPYPKNADIFWQLVKLGAELRKIHLLESPKVEKYITSYPVDGTNQITTKILKKDWEIKKNVKTYGNASETDTQTVKIRINETQYFDNIPLVAWEFYIGGYQPAQKWLKDRSPKRGKEGRKLSYNDILHYQKIIVALSETDRIMKNIDKIKIE